MSEYIVLYNVTTTEYVRTDRFKKTSLYMETFDDPKKALSFAIKYDGYVLQPLTIKTDLDLQSTEQSDSV